jgi:hypothetical protein
MHESRDRLLAIDTRPKSARVHSMPTLYSSHSAIAPCAMLSCLLSVSILSIPEHSAALYVSCSRVGIVETYAYRYNLLSSSHVAVVDLLGGVASLRTWLWFDGARGSSGMFGLVFHHSEGLE